MPTIVVASPKGGVGKSTAALVLAAQLARYTAVTIIDADPNHPIASWARGAHTPSSLGVIADVDEDTIFDRIDDAAARTPFVIVDLEGTASKIAVMAISQADLVIVPMQGSQLDAEQAGRALRLIEQHEKMMRKTNPTYCLPYAVLLTRTNPVIRTRTLAHILKGLSSRAIPVLDTELHEREAFKAMFVFGQPLDRLDPDAVPGPDKAIANAEAFMQEVITTLRRRAMEGA